MAGGDGTAGSDAVGKLGTASDISTDGAPGNPGSVGSDGTAGSASGGNPGTAKANASAAKAQLLTRRSSSGLGSGRTALRERRRSQ
jgi:hypothetical protein